MAQSSWEAPVDHHACPWLWARYGLAYEGEQELAALRALSKMNMMLSLEGASPHIGKEEMGLFG